MATSQAAVYHGPGQPLTLDRYPLPRLAAGEVLVRVTCTTLCGSDVHTYLGHRATPVPTILGHEILGVIEQFGPGESVADYEGRPLAVGDRVTWSVAASCGECFYCARELPQKCEHLFKYGHQMIVPEHRLNGGLAEYCHLAAGTAIVRVPHSLSDEVACPANCATATVAATMRVAGGCRGRIVCIQGAGMLGLTAAAMANRLGAAQVMVTDIDPERLDRARQFGATDTVLVGEDEQLWISRVVELTHGRGVDLALELSGSARAAEAGVALLRIGGRYVLAGTVFPTPAIRIDPEDVVRRLLTICGNHNYRPDDLQAAVSFLAKHAADFAFGSLVGARFPLQEAQAALERAAKGDTLRVAVGSLGVR